MFGAILKSFSKYVRRLKHTRTESSTLPVYFKNCFCPSIWCAFPMSGSPLGPGKVGGRPLRREKAVMGPAKTRRMASSSKAGRELSTSQSRMPGKLSFKRPNWKWEDMVAELYKKSEDHTSAISNITRFGTLSIRRPLSQLDRDVT